MRLPPLELLESTHRFPGPYIFKVVGVPGVIKEAALLAALSPFSQGAMVTNIRHSSGGKHVSITVEARVVNAQAIHDCLTALHGVEGLTMLL